MGVRLQILLACLLALAFARSLEEVSSSEPATSTATPTSKGRLPRYYSDAYARHLYWPLCDIPYYYGEDANATACLNQCFYSSQLITTQQAYCGIGDSYELETCTGSLFLAHDYQAIVLSFRGTTGLDQFDYITETAIYQQPIVDPVMPIGKVNEYYVNAFKQLFLNQVLQDSFNLALGQYPDYDILITGHSLGGALSTLVAAYLRLNYPEVTPERIIVSNFGQVVVGDAEFATNYEQLVPHNQRVVNDNDCVPRFGIDLTINGTDELAYRQVHGDTWYPNNMANLSLYNVCPGLYHDGECTYYYNSTTAPMDDSTLNSHMGYFDIYVPPSRSGVDRCVLCDRTLDLSKLPA